MTLKEFIRANRAEIDSAILGICPDVGHLNDDVRRDWIVNYEPLLLWSQSKGVDIYA